MEHDFLIFPSGERAAALRLQATQIAKAKGMGIAEAMDLVARDNGGLGGWNEAIKTAALTHPMSHYGEKVFEAYIAKVDSYDLTALAIGEGFAVNLVYGREVDEKQMLTAALQGCMLRLTVGLLPSDTVIVEDHDGESRTTHLYGAITKVEPVLDERSDEDRSSHRKLLITRSRQSYDPAADQPAIRRW